MKLFLCSAHTHPAGVDQGLFFFADALSTRRAKGLLSRFLLMSHQEPAAATSKRGECANSEPIPLLSCVTSRGTWSHHWRVLSASNLHETYWSVCAWRPPTCCPKTFLPVHAAWRTTSRSSKSLYPSDICSHERGRERTLWIHFYNTWIIHKMLSSGLESMQFWITSWCCCCNRLYILIISLSADVVLNGHFWHIVTSHCWRGVVSFTSSVSIHLKTCRNSADCMHACLFTHQLQQRAWLCRVWHVAFTEKRKVIFELICFPQSAGHI